MNEKYNLCGAEWHRLLLLKTVLKEGSCPYEI
jgi:hypothetical protein